MTATSGNAPEERLGESGTPRPRRLTAETIALALLALLGGYLAVSSFELGLRTNGSWVAPGTMPLAVGAPLFGIAVTCLVASLLRPARHAEPSDEDSGVDIFGRTAAQRVRQLWTVVGALLLTVALVPIAGFPLSFGALVFFVSTVVERRPLLVASLVTALSLLAVHLVFVMFLGVPLPTGLLGVGSF